MIDRLFFWLLYLMGKAHWDSGIVPPEIVNIIEKGHLAPGRAIDLGCGTGTTSVYLAQHGWQVVGIDFVRAPIRQARAKARRAGVSERTRFVVGDIRRLNQIDLPAPFDLAIDIGCGHILSRDEWQRYAEDLSNLVRPRGTVMLYAFCSTPEHPRGITPEQLKAIFAPGFHIAHVDMGNDQVAGNRSAWYRMERVG